MDELISGDARHTLVSGASGLVGRALVKTLRAQGRSVGCLVRREPVNDDDVLWSPARGTLAPEALDGVDAVVHLAGEPLLGRWTKAKKARILDSRVNGTRLLAEAMARAERPPRVWVSASAIGVYGAQREGLLTEDSSPGDDFLASVCQEWEACTAPAVAAGVRVVNLRISMVLSPDGGALGTMLLPFRLGLGGRLSHGHQWMSWISRPDLIRAIDFALGCEQLTGPVNAAAPEAVQNRVFTKALGAVLRRPTLFPIPGWALRLLFGEVADATMLASARVTPGRLTEAGFEFTHPTLEPALRALLKG